MYQWFIVIGIIVLALLFSWLHNRGGYDEIVFLILAVAFWVVSFGYAFVLPIMLYSNNQNTQVFIQQEQYLTAHVPKSAVEDAALTQKKIELNEWLYSAQYTEQQMGKFAPYSEIVKNLKPIQ
jgi:hypothetical protein